MSETTAIDRRSTAVPTLRQSRVIAATLDQIWTLASRYAKCNMLPAGIKTTEQMYIALLAGYEAGLPLTAAAKSVMVVNNRPTIWGDGAVALVRASGLCEYLKEWMDGEGDDRVAFCETRRRGEANVQTRSFSVADAKRAGLWGKSGPWLLYPDRMLPARARAFLLRDVYADVLMGLSVREEVEDFTHTDTNAAPAADLVDALPVEEPKPDPILALPEPVEGVEEPEVAPSMATPEEFFAAMDAVAKSRNIDIEKFDAFLKQVKLNNPLKTPGQRGVVYGAFVANRIDLATGKLL